MDAMEETTDVELWANRIADFLISMRLTYAIVLCSILNIARVRIEAKAHRKPFWEHLSERHQRTVVGSELRFWTSPILLSGVIVLGALVVAGFDFSHFWVCTCLIIAGAADLIDWIGRWPALPFDLWYHHMGVLLLLVQFGDFGATGQWQVVWLGVGVGLQSIANHMSSRVYYTQEVPRMQEAVRWQHAMVPVKILNMAALSWRIYTAFVEQAPLFAVLRAAMLFGYAYTAVHAHRFWFRFDCAQYHATHQAVWFQGPPVLVLGRTRTVP
ncbi:unnamed protein product [Symbiodinium natans]|uniref:Uncharacterized protein n=1 Tax=Symbiodinium natans TaxID=878477 RepID=A0A812SPQ6_9DINO|nr:unnamed protein product [Symbiodinium natans]